ncbi:MULTISPECIES: shikimate kinase [Flavobacterium]|uniref:shikimate kinase n=1 Tax=Flavobacterium TaxID=237 RepID=UPI001FCB2E92|nr:MULTISPECIES: shikimate kinase [Flavobacterium]UOK42418.1 AAA family ATPase [Flavobacterium enshiense]
MKKIVLVGYMGSGKSTVGKLLSEKTEIPFFDLDAIIEEKEQKTISELFSEIGEIRFRKIEHEMLNNFMAAYDHYILSLGGGTPCYANNHLQLQKEGVDSIYLKGSIHELTKRLMPQKKYRPLIAHQSDEELHEFIAKHLFDRSYFYLKSKHVVSVDGKNPEDVVEEIIRLLA